MRLNVWGLVLAIGMFSALPAAGTASEDVCNSIPSRCIINGKIDKEWLCKIWCEAACGGSACNCDILPVKVAG
ncbi:TPA: hypothetical protein QCH65_004421 [Enterobacter roggenkampii]|nr:hypothetical protein [Enterobacter roggenkampii]